MEIKGFEQTIINDLIKNRDNSYTTFFIQKRSGKKRIIEAPTEDLKKLQTAVLKQVLYKFKPSPYAYGFVVGKNIVNNAEKHLNKKVIVSIDLKDFFLSISRDMIVNALRNECSLNRTDAELIADIVTLKGHLPQGAPTSPAVSNIVARKLDYQCDKIAKQFNATYTRYADDLTFSSDNKELNHIIPIINNIVKNCGLVVNEEKIKIYRNGKRQMVTGIVVNEKTNVQRTNVKNFRAKLHNILKGLKEGSLNKSDVVAQIPALRGYAEFIHCVNIEKGKFFLNQINEIENSI